MSRLSNALTMYMLLQGRSLIKIEELAEILEVSPRTIKGYKKDLEDAGIYIGAKSGRYGGYYLENRIDLKSLGIRKEELEALKMANEIIKSGNHVFSLDFETLANKILNIKRDFDHIDYFNKDNLKPIYMKERESEMWNIISKGIINKKKIRMLYSSIGKGIKKSEKRVRIVHPYGTFDHDGATYFFGYCEMRKEVRHFKLSRIIEVEVLEQKFAINIEYDIKNIMRKSFGIIDDDIFYLKLKISYPMSQLVKEKQYSLDQKITEVDEENIIFEANLKGYQEVKMWVLGMGSKAEVLEPERLRKDVIEEMRKLQKIYELDTNICTNE
ncbi:transcriptional regulator [uncultured Tissierella sp.]|uniref:helix-turn-helix transcriptional regulator n=1 Tax=uncultured Tissierella sp. TaxID=448160 RepID=UPI002804DF86|nr:transcriptional regulator [uncultured Tissierella sp.]MDU5082956.1 transcriptional regulator [Bacillota bacterium]